MAVSALAVLPLLAEHPPMVVVLSENDRIQLETTIKV